MRCYGSSLLCRLVLLIIIGAVATAQNRALPPPSLPCSEPASGDVSEWGSQFRFNSLVTVAVGNLQTGELLGQTLTEPCWQLPEIESMMHQQEYFHASQNLNTEVMSWRQVRRCWRERRSRCIQRSRYRKL